MRFSTTALALAGLASISPAQGFHERRELGEDSRYRIGVPLESEDLDAPVVARSVVDKTYTIGETTEPHYRIRTTVHKTPVHARDFSVVGSVEKRDDDKESTGEKIMDGLEDAWTVTKTAGKVAAKIGLGAVESVERRDEEDVLEEDEANSVEKRGKGAIVKAGMKVAAEVADKAYSAWESWTDNDKRDEEESVRDEEVSEYIEKRGRGTNTKDSTKQNTMQNANEGTNEDTMDTTTDGTKQSKTEKASEGLSLVGDIADAADRLHSAFESWTGSDEEATIEKRGRSTKAKDNTEDNTENSTEDTKKSKTEKAQDGLSLVGDVADTVDRLHSTWKSWTGSDDVDAEVDAIEKRGRGTKAKENAQEGLSLAGDVADAADRVHSAVESWTGNGEEDKEEEEEEEETIEKRGRGTRAKEGVSVAAELAGDVADASDRINTAYENWVNSS